MERPENELHLDEGTGYEVDKPGGVKHGKQYTRSLKYIATFLPCFIGHHGGTHVAATKWRPPYVKASHASAGAHGRAQKGLDAVA